jgi:stress-induced morphogen
MTGGMSDVSEAMRSAIEAALPGARIVVEAAGGGHYRLAVASAAFEGKSTLARHRLVLSAIAPLMAGDGAPVHAIDALETSTP